LFVYAYRDKESCQCLLLRFSCARFTSIEQRKTRIHVSGFNKMKISSFGQYLAGT
jgi:hypothetical protein